MTTETEGVSAMSAELGLLPEQAIRDIANGLNGVHPKLGQWQRDLRLARAVEAATRHRNSAVMEAHTGIRLSTVEYLESMRTRDSDPGCRDCADNDGTCPHDGHKCGT